MIMNSLLKNVENYENSLGIPPKIKNLMNVPSSVYAPGRKIQYKVFEELTKPINSNNELKFEFDFNFENYQTISDLFLLSENITLFSRAELYISNILKSSFSMEAYQLFNGLTKEKEINIFNMFSRGNLPLPLRVKEFKVRILIYFKNIEPNLRCYFKFNANLLAPEQIQKFYSESLQYNIYTYYEKSFSLRDEMISIPIEYNNPISFIGVIFDNNIESINVQIDSLKLIPNHLTTNKLHNSFGPDYEINNNTQFKLIFPAVMLTLLVALILKSDVELIDPVPVAVDVNVFAKTLPVNLILPPETMLKSPVALNVPVPGAVDIKLLAITLPALMLPVYVVRNAPTFALPYVLITGFAARYAITLDTTRAFE
jgi:hypothetical protein